MLKNYFIIAIRNFSRHKLFSAINMLCLAIGITFSIIIGVYILHQKNVNGSIKNIDRQYAIKSKWKAKEMGMPVTTIGPLAKTLKDEYPNLVVNYFRYNPITNVVSAGDRHFKENMAICDTSLVSMYGFPLLYGDEKKAFKNNSSAVITEAMAIKLFGTTNALNKIITISNIGKTLQDYSVSAVLKNMPFNSVNNFLDFDGYNVFLPFEGNHYYGDNSNGGENDWNQIFMVGMIELNKGASVNDVKKAADKILALNLPNNLKGLLQPEFASLKDYYLLDNNAAVKKMIGTLSIVALFILVMAIINYVNINIGTSSYRLKEIGLRKVFGSDRTQLMAQHLTESLVITFFAGILSLFFYEIFRSYFSQVLNTPLDPVFQFRTTEWLSFFALLIAVGVVSGIYPAFILSATNIIHSVKGKLDSSAHGVIMRKAFLIIQFSLAIVVFISALNISRQVSYFFDKDIGYKKDQLLVLTTFPKQWDSVGVQKMQTIRNEMQNVPNVQSASLSFEVPDRVPPFTMGLLPAGSNQTAVVHVIVADENFGKTYGMEMKKGNFFDDYRRSPAKNELVVNETAAKILGINSVNTIIRTPTANNFTVSGIIKDFNYSSFQESIRPLVFIHVRDATQYRYLSFKINSANIEQTIASLKEKWKLLSPGAPFEFTFMDERFRFLYKSEIQLKQAAKVATILNIVIVLIGIFGVVAFTLARRNKEIAIRKVLGADVKNILLLFIKDYAWLILIANIIAWPLAYVISNKWLENYTYRIQQNIVPYIFVLTFIFISAFILIAAQCFKAAVENPVKNLRTE